MKTKKDDQFDKNVASIFCGVGVLCTIIISCYFIISTINFVQSVGKLKEQVENNRAEFIKWTYEENDNIWKELYKKQDVVQKSKGKSK